MQKTVAGRSNCRFCRSVALAGIAWLSAWPVCAQTQRSAFTIADPAPTSQVFRFDSTATHGAPSTIVPRLTGPEPPHETLRDSETGAKIDEFGSAYNYANPLYGTYYPGAGVGLQDSSGRSATINFVVARFGGPPQPLPAIAGVDPSPTQPDVALICYALRMDGGAFPDIATARVLDLATHAMGRARVTRIDIAPAWPLADREAQQAVLHTVALALVHQGVHPAAILSQGQRVLPRGLVERGEPVPGHVVSLLLTAAAPDKAGSGNAGSGSLASGAPDALVELRR